MPKTVPEISSAPKALGPYSFATEASGLVFLSGQVALDRLEPGRPAQIAVGRGTASVQTPESRAAAVQQALGAAGVAPVFGDDGVALGRAGTLARVVDVEAAVRAVVRVEGQAQQSTLAVATEPGVVDEVGDVEEDAQLLPLAVGVRGPFDLARLLDDEDGPAAAAAVFRNLRRPISVSFFSVFFTSCFSIYGTSSHS